MCDTFVVLPAFTADGSVLFGKNSDREPNEAQALEFRPGATHPRGRTVRCTYLEIPQVAETHAVLLCRPFWMWGAEMGANEKGVVIGNEAVFTRMPVSRSGGLTGMDMLRLALERAGTAEQAVEVMIQLLSDHGQGGVCGFEDKRMAYHNSFLCADPKGAWILETAGHLWATRRVAGLASISNGLTIGKEFDACHPDMIPTARERGWLKKGKTFDFSRCFSDWLYTTFSACGNRQNRSLALIRRGRTTEGKGEMDVRSAMGALRDHRDQEYRPDRHLLGDRLCAHAANRVTRNATQTTGSFIGHLKSDLHTFWVTGTSAPCTGVFKPVWFGTSPLPDTGPAPAGTFDADTLWWRHERLHRSVLLDYPVRIQVYREERDALEEEFLDRAEPVPPGKQSELTETAFAQAHGATDRWIEQVRGLSIKGRTRWSYRRYWRHQNRKAGIDIG